MSVGRLESSLVDDLGAAALQRDGTFDRRVGAEEYVAAAAGLQRVHRVACLLFHCVTADADLRRPRSHLTPADEHS